MIAVIEFLQNHWGDLVSVAGLIASLGGLIWAIRAQRAAVAAENAAEAAERGAKEAADGIGRTLTVADVQRAISLIERIKERVAAGRWDAAAERCPDLRELLYNIEARLPDEYGEMREGLTVAVGQAQELERLVNRLRLGYTPPEYSIEIVEALNYMQALLQRIASRLNWERSQGRD